MVAIGASKYGATVMMLVRVAGLGSFELGGGA